MEQEEKINVIYISQSTDVALKEEWGNEEWGRTLGGTKWELTWGRKKALERNSGDFAMILFGKEKYCQIFNIMLLYPILIKFQYLWG